MQNPIVPYTESVVYSYLLYCPCYKNKPNFVKDNGLGIPKPCIQSSKDPIQPSPQNAEISIGHCWGTYNTQPNEGPLMLIDIIHESWVLWAAV